jgi:sigma-E factor negative regulatory protein RseC
MIKTPNNFGKNSEAPTEMAQVLSLEGDLAVVKPQFSSVCESCGSSSMCFPQNGEEPEIRALNVAEAKPGDLVMIEQTEGSRISASLIVFGLPILMMVGGTILGMNSTGDSSGGAAVGAVAGLAFGGLLVSFINKILKDDRRLNPVVKEIVSHHNPDVECNE